TRSGERYYVFPMQLDSDSQVTAHSEFTGMEQALEHVIGSFAVNAPRDTQIVVKLHPLDNGWINFRRLTDAIAARWGVSSRVTFIDGGNLDALVDGSLGVVTLNSTVGLSALKRGKPVICLAKAIFDVPGLTFQGDIDRFWGVERGPDNALLQRFLAYLTRRALIVGDFYTAEGVALAVTNAIDRFEAVSVPEAAGSTGQSWVSQSDTRSEKCRSTKPAKRSVS
ncbi:MAG: capsular biosynthesis protein, partial [Parvibaculum sp.]|nr:capsular biosynthesis protein [Parvibaculum sp.]MBO6906527.1 capsular biosynthesis protein [Parvibaculum sp.]